MTTQRYYSLKVVAQTLGVHPQAIRLYEREGLVSSIQCGSERYYAVSQIDRLRVIVQLRQELGINLAGIEVILHMRDRLQELARQTQGPAAAEPQPEAPRVTIPIRDDS